MTPTSPDLPRTVKTGYRDGSVLMGACCRQVWTVQGGGWICGTCKRSWRVTVEDAGMEGLA